MADTEVPNLASAGALSAADVTLLTQSGVSKKVDLTTLSAYFAPPANASVSGVTGYAADTYLAGSSISVPLPSRLKAGSFYRCQFNVVKTAAGIAAPVISVRYGTAGTTADTARTSVTFAAQTGVIDQGKFEILVNWRAVGASAVLQAVGILTHGLATTGLNVTATNSFITPAAGSSFDSTTVNSFLGLSVNAGASASWTVSVVQAELLNIA